MSETRTWQLHANVNADHGDAALRVSVTFYDESGHQVGHKTWRKHVRALWYEGADWTAYSGVTELARMMGEICGSGLEVDEPDEPLFSLA